MQITDDTTRLRGGITRAVVELVMARAALSMLNDREALNGVDEFHDAYRCVTRAAEALGVHVADLDAMAQRVVAEVRP